jgi:hypothetical protein
MSPTKPRTRNTIILRLYNENFAGRDKDVPNFEIWIECSQNEYFFFYNCIFCNSFIHKHHLRCFGIRKGHDLFF